jgi:hypothetical protein
MPPGRKPKDNNTIKINDLHIQLVSRKQDNYGTDITYFKIVDANLKTKMKQLMSIEDIKMPYFTGDNNCIILKVKEKFICLIDETDLQLKKTYLANVEFEYYSYSPEGSETTYVGYYAKIPLMRASPSQVV